MTASTLEERKRRIREIKASFGNPAQSQRYSDLSAAAPESIEGMGFFKVKLLIAIAIFAVFVFCDRNQIAVGGFSVETAFEAIKEPLPLKEIEQRLDKIMQSIENME